MIYSQPHPLQDPRVKAIREWLREPACREFANWLADRAAYFSAEAGNSMVEGEESDISDATESAQKARYYLKAWEIMVEVMNPDYVFEVAELLPKPLTT